MIRCYEILKTETELMQITNALHLLRFSLGLKQHRYQKRR